MRIFFKFNNSVVEWLPVLLILRLHIRYSKYSSGIYLQVFSIHKFCWKMENIFNIIDSLKKVILNILELKNI